MTDQMLRSAAQAVVDLYDRLGDEVLWFTDEKATLDALRAALAAAPPAGLREDDLWEPCDDLCPPEGHLALDLYGHIAAKRGYEDSIGRFVPDPVIGVVVKLDDVKAILDKHFTHKHAAPPAGLREALDIDAFLAAFEDRAELSREWRDGIAYARLRLKRHVVAAPSCGHPHDGYAYDGCKCVCCLNVRALQAPPCGHPSAVALRHALNSLPARGLDDDGDGYGGVPYISLSEAMHAIAAACGEEE